MGWWSVGKDLLRGHLLGPDAGSSVPAPVFLSPGNSSPEWLPPQQKFGAVKLGGAEKPASRRRGYADQAPATQDSRSRAGGVRANLPGRDSRDTEKGEVSTDTNQSRKTLPRDQHRPIGGRGNSGGEIQTCLRRRAWIPSFLLKSAFWKFVRPRKFKEERRRLVCRLFSHAGE